MDNNLIDKKTAYTAMFEFLSGHYERTKSDDIGALLGGMCLLDDNCPADPAIWSDWEKCITKAEKNNIDTSLKIKS